MKGYTISVVQAKPNITFLKSDIKDELYIHIEENKTPYIFK